MTTIVKFLPDKPVIQTTTGPVMATQGKPFQSDRSNNPAVSQTIMPDTLPIHSHDGLGSHSHSFSSPSHQRGPTGPVPATDPDLSSPSLREFYHIPSGMDPEEASYLLRTILSFKHYTQQTFIANHVRMQNFYALPEAHRRLLQPEFTKKLQAIDAAIERNGVIARKIARLGEEMYLGGAEAKLSGPVVPKERYPSFYGEVLI